MLKKSLHQIMCLACLTVVLGLTACGIRPYDYLAPQIKTISAPFKDSPTPSAAWTHTPMFTPPLAAGSPSPTQHRSPTPQIITPTLAQSRTPVLEGSTSLTLENHSRRTLIVTLQREGEWGFELVPAATYSIDLPAGVYDYWIVQSGAKSLRGEIIFPPGLITWTLYDTPNLIDSPTPKWEYLP